ncbi:MAG: ATP-binding protein [Thermodesulfovibrionales bacterium]|nr:ATP-binding protein [Thermodesulfovibrionales bacterium]
MRLSQTVEGSFSLIGGDFSNGGAASCELKSILERLGLPEDIIQRATISAFEAEMNVIIHAIAGTMVYSVTPERIKIVVTDMGPGIPDIELAMQEGYSTAPDWVKEMGWGAGMGLPNMKKNADVFNIDTVVGEGTTVELIIYIPREWRRDETQ